MGYELDDYLLDEESARSERISVKFRRQYKRQSSQRNRLIKGMHDPTHKNMFHRSHKLTVAIILIVTISGIAYYFNTSSNAADPLHVSSSMRYRYLQNRVLYYYEKLTLGNTDAHYRRLAVQQSEAQRTWLKRSNSNREYGG